MDRCTRRAAGPRAIQGPANIFISPVIGEYFRGGGASARRGIHAKVVDPPSVFGQTEERFESRLSLDVGRTGGRMVCGARCARATTRCPGWPRLISNASPDGGGRVARCSRLAGAPTTLRAPSQHAGEKRGAAARPDGPRTRRRRRRGLGESRAEAAHARDAAPGIPRPDPAHTQRRPVASRRHSIGPAPPIRAWAESRCIG